MNVSATTSRARGSHQRGRSLWLALGVILVSLFATVASASAAHLQVQYLNQDSGHQYPNQALAPADVKLTAVADPGDPPASTYKWNCNADNGGVSVTGDATHTCHYTTAGTYDAVVTEARSDGSTYFDGIYITVKDRSDEPAPLTYSGPTTLTRSTLFRVQTPKPHLDVYGYAGHAFTIEARVCPAGSPRTDHCFLLGQNSPVNRDVVLNMKAWTYDPNYADEQQQTVHVTADPPPSFHGFKTGFTARRTPGKCQFGTVVTGSASPSYRLSEALVFEQVRGGRWRTFARRSIGSSLVFSPGRLVRPLGGPALSGASIKALLARRGAVRMRATVTVKDASGYLRYHASPRRSLTRSRLRTCR